MHQGCLDPREGAKPWLDRTLFEILFERAFNLGSSEAWVVRKLDKRTALFQAWQNFCDFDWSFGRYGALDDAHRIGGTDVRAVQPLDQLGNGSIGVKVRQAQQPTKLEGENIYTNIVLVL